MNRKILAAALTLVLGSTALAARLPYRNYGGKYPYEIAKIDGSITRKLKQLLGHSYGLYQQNSAVQTPCVVRDGYLVLSGCRAHACNSDTSFALVDVNKGTTYAAIVSDADTSARKVKVFNRTHNALPRLFRRLMAGEEIQ